MGVESRTAYVWPWNRVAVQLEQSLACVVRNAHLDRCAGGGTVILAVAVHGDVAEEQRRQHVGVEVGRNTLAYSHGQLAHARKFALPPHPLVVRLEEVQVRHDREQLLPAS